MQFISPAKMKDEGEDGDEEKKKRQWKQRGNMYVRLPSPFLTSASREEQQPLELHDLALLVSHKLCLDANKQDAPTAGCP